MHKVFFRVLFFLFLTMGHVLAHAQGSSSNEKPQMADAMRSSGKIYVVVTVLVIILIGLFIYLITLDRKISRLEKSNK